MSEPVQLHPSSKNEVETEAVRLHALYQGKMQVALKCPIRGPGDFVYWYTPGVAAPCREIQAQPARVYDLTNKANLVAIVSDGSRVLGLGNIGPHAGLPVMDGKALLFKYLAGVDAVALCLATQNESEIVRTVETLEPAFGGINLEDIASPGCFRVLAQLRKKLPIPVWHDDQQGTATAVVAGLIGALKVTGKQSRNIRLAIIGAGAANIATLHLLEAYGIRPEQVVAVDSQGTLHAKRADIESNQVELAEKWRICRETNPEKIIGGIAEAMRGADVCICFSSSGPGVLKPQWVRAMNKNAIVFACANPVPEIWPQAAIDAGAQVVATGRSDFANQVNNSLVFPGIFRGTLDARAVAISDQMALAAACELARCAEERGLSANAILPRMDACDVVARVAAATAIKAQESGLARVSRTREQYMEAATCRIRESRQMLQALMREGLIAAPAEGSPCAPL